MLKEETAAKVRKYVEQGGTLISEGLPGYFGDHGHVGTVQPNYGLHEVFGAGESYVEFLPDISDDLMFQVNGAKINGRYFRQEYKLQGGSAAGQYENGNVAAVQNKFGQGKTLLMGSFPGAGYYLHHAPAAKTLFASFLEMAGVEPQLKTDDSSVQARLHRGDGGNYLWIINPNRDDRKVTVRLATAAGSFTAGQDLWGKQGIQFDGQQVTVTVPGRDGAVIALR